MLSHKDNSGQYSQGKESEGAGKKIRLNIVCSAHLENRSVSVFLRSTYCKIYKVKGKTMGAGEVGEPESTF